MSSDPEQYLDDETLDEDTSSRNQVEPDNIRRTTRIRKKPKKYGISPESSEGTSKSYNLSSEDDNDEDLHLSPERLLKPTALFDQDDVGGQDIFKFKARHTKNDLQNKVKLAMINTPARAASAMKTPKKNQTLKVSDATTPQHVTNIIKKKIMCGVESDNSDSDFSDSSSDFIPDKSDSESTTSSSGDNSEEEDSKEEEYELPRKSSKQSIVKSKEILKKLKDLEFFVTPDNYFTMHSSKKIMTSDHTLARLKNINLSDDTKEADDYVSTEHRSKILDLVQSYHQLFNRWLYVLSEDFNIILYGIGSKRSVIHQFQMQKLGDMPCIVINGFFPSLTIKNVLETIVIDLLENSMVPSNIGDVISLIDSQLSASDTHLFLLVHNIDGPMLRNAKCQSVLASLSHLKNVHTIASIDHINAPLLWDHTKLSKFKFTWWDATTFLPYTEETSYENSIMTQRSGALQLSSLKSVYQSLTTNAKGIFNIIIQYQLEHQKQAHYQGLPFRDLYSKAREQFLVSSDVALRAQLTEFLDHKLAKIKRSCDGSENLVLTIESALLQQFLEENN